MNTIENQGRDSARDDGSSTARSQRVSAVAWLAGITAVVALGILSQDATIGMGLGVIGVSGMVAVVSYFILREMTSPPDQSAGAYEGCQRVSAVELKLFSFELFQRCRRFPFSFRIEFGEERNSLHLTSARSWPMISS